MKTNPANRTIFLSDNLFSFGDGVFAVRVENGIIAAIDPWSDSTSAKPHDAEIIDLRVKAVFPGFADSHVHLMGTAMQLVTPSVRGVSSLDELDKAIEKSELKNDLLNKFSGIDLSEFPNRAEVNAAHLDRKYGGHPIFIKSIEGHSGLFNSSGLRWMNLEAGMEGVELDSAGRPTGVVRGEAYENLVDDIYDSYTEDEKLRGLGLAVGDALSKGTTGIHCLEGYGHDRAREFATILEFNKTCAIDLLMYPRIGPNPTSEDFDAVVELGLTRVGGCELIDGAIGSFTAAMRDPYVGTSNLGKLYKSDEEIEDYYRNAFLRGLQPCFHVIGDRAIEQCLHVLEKLDIEMKGRGEIQGVSRFRPRLDHFICAHDEDIARAARLGVCAGVQPSFMRAWGEKGGKYEGALGRERWPMLHRYGAMTRGGMLIAAGSDSYITPIDPPLQIASMMHHFNRRERVSFDDAVLANTLGAAVLGFSEKVKGKIAPGYDATFTVLESTQPISENSPENTSVHSVWIRGEKVWPE